MTSHYRVLCGVLAMLVSAVCAVMAAAAAADRASTDADRWIMTAIAVSLALGSHVLPALVRRGLFATVLVTGCMVATVYHHAHYFASAQSRASAVRADAVSISTKAQALSNELDANATTRPLPDVTKDLAQATAKAAQVHLLLSRCKADNNKCGATEAAAQAADAKVQALADERVMALRVAELRQQLAAEAATHDQQRTAHAADPVDAQLAALTGLNEKAIALLLALAQSLMLELLAVVLWLLALPERKAEAAVVGVAEDTKMPSFLSAKPETASHQRPVPIHTPAPPTAMRWWARWKHLWPWPWSFAAARPPFHVPSPQTPQL